jgi:hypothetical protein
VGGTVALAYARPGGTESGRGVGALGESVGAVKKRSVHVYNINMAAIELSYIMLHSFANCNIEKQIHMKVNNIH